MSHVTPSGPRELATLVWQEVVTDWRKYPRTRKWYVLIAFLTVFMFAAPIWRAFNPPLETAADRHMRAVFRLRTTGELDKCKRRCIDELLAEEKAAK